MSKSVAVSVAYHIEDTILCHPCPDYTVLVPEVICVLLTLLRITTSTTPHLEWLTQSACSRGREGRREVGWWQDSRGGRQDQGRLWGGWMKQ